MYIKFRRCTLGLDCVHYLGCAKYLEVNCVLSMQDDDLTLLQLFSKKMEKEREGKGRAEIDREREGEREREGGGGAGGGRVGHV